MITKKELEKVNQIEAEVGELNYILRGMKSRDDIGLSFLPYAVYFNANRDHVGDFYEGSANWILKNMPDEIKLINEFAKNIILSHRGKLEGELSKYIEEVA